MKIAVICSHSHTLYWYRLELLQEFIKNGHEVYGFADEPEELWAELFAEKGITYKQIHISRNSMNPFTDVRTYFSIRHALKELKPDKVLVFHAKAVVYGSLAANHLKIRDVYPLMTGLGSVFIDGGKKRKAVKNILVTEYRVALKNCPVLFFQNHDDKQVFFDNKIIKKQRTVAAVIFAVVKSRKGEKKLKKLNVSRMDGFYPVLNLSKFWQLTIFFVFVGLTLAFAYTGGSPFIYGNY